jgi:hypothetical protein
MLRFLWICSWWGSSLGNQSGLALNRPQEGHPARQEYVKNVMGNTGFVLAAHGICHHHEYTSIYWTHVHHSVIIGLEPKPCLMYYHESRTACWINLYAWKIQNGTNGNVQCRNFSWICLMQLPCWNNAVYGSALLWVILDTSVCQGMEISCHWGLNNVV